MFSPEFLLITAAAEGRGFATSAEGNSTPSGNSLMTQRGG